VQNKICNSFFYQIYFFIKSVAPEGHGIQIEILGSQLVRAADHGGGHSTTSSRLHRSAEDLDPWNSVYGSWMLPLRPSLLLASFISKPSHGKGLGAACDN
jgi:hypothetical protein